MPIDPVGGSSYICLGPWSERPPLLVSDRRPTAVRHNRSLFSRNCSKTVLYFPHNSCKPLMTVRYTIYRNSFSFDVVRLQTTMLFASCLYQDPVGVLRVGGRVQTVRYPATPHGKHQVTKLIIYSEHLHLLHAGPTLVTVSLCGRYHIVGSRMAVRSVTCGCIVCR